MSIEVRLDMSQFYQSSITVVTLSGDYMSGTLMSRLDICFALVAGLIYRMTLSSVGTVGKRRA
jgi:hypothetical protein